jgi:hypothetical protein
LWIQALRALDQRGGRIDADRFDCLGAQHPAKAAFSATDIERVPGAQSANPRQHRRIEHEPPPEIIVVDMGDPGCG